MNTQINVIKADAVDTETAKQVLKAYDWAFKVWPGDKRCGRKPTADELITYHRLSARHGKQCLAGAMALRPDGVTGAEIVMACGAQQLNKMRGFVTDGLVKQVTMGKRNNSVIYKLVLTPKGEKRVAATIKRELELVAAGEVAVVEAAKPAGAVKAKKAAKPADGKKRTSKPRKAADVPVDQSTGEPEAAVNDSRLPDVSPLDAPEASWADQPVPATGDVSGNQA